MGVCQGSCRLRLVAGPENQPPYLGTQGRGHAGHDQCDERRHQPGHSILSRTTQNAGWPYFDGTNRDYPAFKRKFASFQANYHYGTPSRELV